MQVIIENNDIVYGEIKAIYIEEFSRSRYEICLIGYNNFIEKEIVHEDPRIFIMEDDEDDQTN